MANELSLLVAAQSLAPLLSTSLATWVARVAPIVVSLAATYLLHSTLLLCGAWLAVRFVRLRSEALKERLWKLAAVLPLCTAPLQLMLDVSPPTFELARHRASIVYEEPAVATTVPQSEPIDLSALAEPPQPPILPTVPDNFPELPAAVLVEEPPTIVAENPPLVVPDADVAPATSPVDPIFVWIGWSFVMLVGFGLVRLVVQSFLFARCLRNCTEVREPSVRRILDEIARLARVRRRFRLLVSPTFRQPAAFGMLRWMIVVPEEVLRTFEPAELRGVLAHEAAHLVRGDALWLWIGRVLCACLAIQPLNFVARRGWRRSAEILCDEWAIAHSANGLALARCLTHIAELNSPNAPRLQALWTLGAVSHLGERVERLVNGAPTRDAWNTRARARLVTLAAAGIASLFVCAAPRTTVLAGAGKGGVDDHGSLAAFASLSPNERATATAIEQELAQLHDEVVEMTDFAESRRFGGFPAGDPRVVELTRRIATRAGQLHDRYRRLTYSAITAADRSVVGPDRVDLSQGAEP